MLDQAVKHLNTTNPDRRYPSKFVLEVCRAVSGWDVSDRTFRNWKIAAGSCQYRRDLFWGECLALLAIAYLKRDAPNRRVSEEEVLGTMTERQNRQIFFEYLNGDIQVGIKGKELGKVLSKQLGSSAGLSRASLFRKLRQFGYSESKIYYAREVDRFVDILRSRSETEISL